MKILKSMNLAWKQLFVALAVSMASLFCIALPSLAQVGEQGLESNSDNTLDADTEVVDNACPLTIDALTINVSSISIEKRFNALMRLLNQSSECNHDLDSQESRILALLDEAYEEGLIAFNNEELIETILGHDISEEAPPSSTTEQRRERQVSIFNSILGHDISEEVPSSSATEQPRERQSVSGIRGVIPGIRGVIQGELASNSATEQLRERQPKICEYDFISSIWRRCN